MDACVANWDLLYKFFQTSITVGIAIVIYILWHRQKAKEVLANESKEVIKDCLEFKFYLNDLEFYELRPVVEYQESLNTIKKTSTQIERSLLFLQKNDPVLFLGGQHDNVWTRKRRIIRILNDLIENYEIIESNNEVYSKLKEELFGEIHRMSKSLTKIVDYLQPFSIFQLNFNQKKLAKSILESDLD